jgi:hypothetical protein
MVVPTLGQTRLVLDDDGDLLEGKVEWRRDPGKDTLHECLETRVAGGRPARGGP